MSISPRKWRKDNGEWTTAYRVYFRDKDGVERRKQFKKRKDADKFLKQLGVEEPEGQSTDARPTGAPVVPVVVQHTIQDAAKLWLEACEKGLGEHHKLDASTIYQYQGHVTNHIVPMVGARPIKLFTVQDSKEFRDSLLLRIPNRRHAKKILVSFKGVLNEAVEKGWLEFNPAQSVKIKLTSRDKFEIAIPQPEEIRELLRLARERISSDDLTRAKGYQRFYPILLTAAVTGLRASELRGLAWSAMDIRRHILKVVQRADAWNTIGPPKSRSGYRAISIPEVLVEALGEWKVYCPKSELDLVFPNWQGNVESLSNLWNRFLKPLQIALGMGEGKKARYSFHAMRHFRASVLISSRCDPKRVQTEMGHSSIQTTYDIYGHLFREQDSEGKARADRLATDYLGWVAPSLVELDTTALPVAAGVEDEL